MVNGHSETSMPDHTAWSLCCWSFVAFAYPMESWDWRVAGEVTGAQAYASTTKCLHIWAPVSGLLLIITLIIIFAHWLTDDYPSNFRGRKML